MHGDNRTASNWEGSLAAAVVASILAVGRLVYAVFKIVFQILASLAR